MSAVAEAIKGYVERRAREIAREEIVKVLRELTPSIDDIRQEFTQEGKN